MKNLILICAFLGLSSCGQNQDNQNSCTVSNILPGTSVGAPWGGSKVSCPDGTNSLIVNGAPGTPGSIVKPVQFCPGTPSYPSTFPEVGFNINGSIYAVYSQNDGFLTLIPPGVYTSNAVGSACNFTVNADGTITN